MDCGKTSGQDCAWQYPLPLDTIAKFKAGEGSVFVVLYGALDDRLRRYFRRRRACEDDVDDLVGIVWATVYLKRVSFSARGTLGGWVLAIARSTAAGFAKTNVHEHHLRSACDDELDRIESTAISDLDATQIAQREDKRLRQLIRLIATLPQRQASVVAMRLFDNQRFSGIAAVLNIKPSTARATYRDALARLRRLFEAERLPRDTFAPRDYTQM